jgi:hypothetical protein
MLASTVQFSRYGRIRNRDHRGAGDCRPFGAESARMKGWVDARSLRTQQRTYGHSLVPHSFLLALGARCTGREDTENNRTSQCSTHERTTAGRTPA